MTPLPPRHVSPTAQLRIMATTDLHVHLFPYDYYADQPNDAVGLARTAALILKARAEVAQSLLFDNGDFLQGNPVGDYVAQGRGVAPATPHPMIIAMNGLEYDAVALGNHEFNYGLDFLDQVLSAADFPVLCANVTRLGKACRETDPILPWALLTRMLTLSDGTRKDLRIGVIGFVPPQITIWDKEQLGGLIDTHDILDTATGMIPQLKAAGADIIVALAHSGIGAPDARPNMENAATALAGLPGIDAVVAGHSHLVFPSDHFLGMPGIDVAAGTLMGKPAVMAGFWGSHLGIIDLTLTLTGQAWQISGSHSEARPILRREADWTTAKPTVASAPAVLNAAARDHAATLTYVRRPIGFTDTDLNTYFALVCPSPCTRIVAEAQHAHVTAFLRDTDHVGLPILSAAAPFKAGGRGGVSHYTDIPKGDLALRHLSDLYLFPNTIRAVRVTGAMVADWLEHGAGVFRHIHPGTQDQLLIDPSFPSYNFDTIYGLTYRIDLSRPARFDQAGHIRNPDSRRITNLCLDGKALDPRAELIVATNNYRAAGGGDFPHLKGADRVVLESPDANRDILVRHVLAGGGSFGRQAADVWRFAPMAGTSVLFDSAPRALPHLHQLPAHLAIDAAGCGADGFARFRIHL